MTDGSKNSTRSIMIRGMSHKDLDVITALEKDIFPDSWPRSAFEDQLSVDGWGGIVAETDGEIIGYACFMTVASEQHLTNIAVVPNYRRKLVAKQLLDTILQVGKDENCEFILLEVRPSNLEAIKFYEKHNFKVLYQRPKYYSNPVEDALVMVFYFED